MNMLARLFSRRSTSAEIVSTSVSAWAGGPEDACIIVPGTLLLQEPAYQELLEKIEIAFGETPERYRFELLPLLEHAAEIMQLLPASRFNHHYQPGGLVLHSLHVVYLTLKMTTSFTPYLPDPRPSRSEKDEFEFYAKLVFATMAMVHDIGKVATDVNFDFLDGRRGRLLQLPRYDLNGLGGSCSQTLSEYARRHIGEDLSRAFYRWNHRNGRLANGHHSYILPAANELFRATCTQLPAAVRGHYLDPNAALFKKMRDVIQTADRESVKQYLRHSPQLIEFGRHKVHPRALGCIGVLRHLSFKQHLNDLEEVIGCAFLPVQLFERFLPGLPKLDDFALAPVTSPEGYLKANKAHGFHVEVNREPGNPMELTRFHGRMGLFVNPRITAAIDYWAKRPELCEGPVDVDRELSILLGEEDYSNNVVIDISAAEPEPQALPSLPDPEDVSSCGVDVPNSSESLSSVDAPDDPWPDIEVPPASQQLSSLQPTYPDELVEFAKLLEALTDEDLSEPLICVEEDGCLVFQKGFISDLLSNIDIDRFEDFASLSEEYFSDRWTVLRDPALQGLRCTAEYSQALLNRDVAHYLLLTGPRDTAPSRTHVRPIDDSVPQEPALESSNHVAESANKSSSPVNPDALTLAGFLDSLRSSSLSRDHHKRLALESKFFRVPIAFIDEYIVAKHRRGELINVFVKEEALSRRNKKYFYFNANHEEVAACLDELDIV